jgi:hypothetical protein
VNESLEGGDSLTDRSFVSRVSVTINHNSEASQEVRVLFNVGRGGRELRRDGSVDIKWEQIL